MADRYAKMTLLRFNLRLKVLAEAGRHEDALLLIRTQLSYKPMFCLEVLQKLRTDIAEKGPCS